MNNLETLFADCWSAPSEGASNSLLADAVDIIHSFIAVKSWLTVYENENVAVTKNN